MATTIVTLQMLLCAAILICGDPHSESVVVERPSVRESVEAREGALRCTSTFYTPSRTPWALSLQWRYNVSLDLLCRVVRTHTVRLTPAPPEVTSAKATTSAARTSSGSGSGSRSRSRSRSRSLNESLFMTYSTWNGSVSETAVDVEADAAAEALRTTTELAPQFQVVELEVDVLLAATLKLRSSEPKFLRLLTLQPADETLAGRCVPRNCSLKGLLMRSGRPLHLHVSFFTRRIGKLVLSLSARFNYTLPPLPPADSEPTRAAAEAAGAEGDEQRGKLLLAKVPVRVARIKSALDYAFEDFVLLLSAMLCVYAGFGSELRHVISFIRGQKAVICCGLVAQNLVMPLVSISVQLVDRHF